MGNSVSSWFILIVSNTGTGLNFDINIDAVQNLQRHLSH